MYANKSFSAKKLENILDAPEQPKDTISDIAFNLEGTHVAVSSWDSSIYLYKLPTGYSSKNLTFEKTFPLSKPCLSVSFFGANIIAGLVDGSLVVLDINNNQTIIQAHSAGVKNIRNYANQYIITGSFDSTIKFWDLKSSEPMHIITLPAKVYAMHLRGSILAIALSNKTALSYNLSNISDTTTFTTRFSHSLRSVCISHDQDIIAIAGIEGKVELLSKANEASKSVFRCHRTGNKLFSVNIIRFYKERIVVSGGADGRLEWYDVNSRYKLLTLEYGAPVTAGEFTNDSKYFIFAIGDDWSKGFTGTPVLTQLKIMDVASVPEINK